MNENFATYSSTFIKTDGNAIINERNISWVKKMNECLEVCMKTTGCTNKVDTHTICKTNSPISYAKLNNHFEQN